MAYIASFIVLADKAAGTSMSTRPDAVCLHVLLHDYRVNVRMRLLNMRKDNYLY